MRAAGRWLAEAAGQGARLAVLPENFAYMPLQERERLALAEDAPSAAGEPRGPIQAFLADSANTHGLWLVGGTLALKSADPGHVYSACLVYDNHGALRARYDKLHLFDVDIPGRGERYRESASTTPGQTTVVVATPFGQLGLAVCYDLRFPEMFRLMLDAGMTILAVPSAFTAATGRAHWELLVRARAVENLTPVIAAAQGGHHDNGRQTHGHSMIVDEWGRILDCRPEEGPGLVTARLEPAGQALRRREFPVLAQRRYRVQ